MTALRKIFEWKGSSNMDCRIILFNNSRTRVGKIVLHERQITLDVDKNMPGQIVTKLSEFLERISKDEGVKVSRSVNYTKPDGVALNVQEAVKISLEDTRFISALIDRINHLMKGQEQIFAVKEVSQ